MPSRISQMRNAAQMPQQSQLDRSIEQVRNMMQQIKYAKDPQAKLAELLQTNSNTNILANMLKSNGNLELLAQQMASQYHIDLDQLIRQLQGGM